MDQGLVGWWEGKEFRTTPARVVDISSGGARLSIAPQPIASTSVWLSLVGGASTEWLSARVVGGSGGEGEPQWVRVEFADQCPYDTFKLAVWGDPSARRNRPAPAPTSVDPETTPPAPVRSFRLAPKRVPGHRAGRPVPCLPVTAAEARHPRDLPLSITDHHPARPAPCPSTADESEPHKTEAPPCRPPPTLLASHRTQRAQLDRVGLLSYAVPIVSSLAVIAVLVLVVTQAHGKLRIIDVIRATCLN